MPKRKKPTTRAAKTDDGGMSKSLTRLFRANKIMVGGMADAVSSGYDAFATAVNTGDGANAVMSGWLAAMDVAADSFEKAGWTVFHDGNGNGSPKSVARKKRKKPAA